MDDLAHNGKSHFMEPLFSRLGLPDILLDRQSGEPLYGQITRQMAEAIREGKLRRGERLPSTRAMARMLGISRNTVLIAYETLAADDLTHSMHGSGARVKHSALVTLPPIARLLSAAMYPQVVTLISDSDGNPLYLRHPELR